MPKLPPGPWRWENGRLFDVNGAEILSADLVEYDGAPAGLLFAGSDVLAADHPLARAIAALPELVEALQELVERRERAAMICGSRDGTDGRYARARAALEKAGLGDA